MRLQRALLLSCPVLPWPAPTWASSHASNMAGSWSSTTHHLQRQQKTCLCRGHVQTAEFKECTRGDAVMLRGALVTPELEPASPPPRKTTTLSSRTCTTG